MQILWHNPRPESEATRVGFGHILNPKIIQWARCVENMARHHLQGPYQLLFIWHFAPMVLGAQGSGSQRLRQNSPYQMRVTLDSNW